MAVRRARPTHRHSPRWFYLDMVLSYIVALRLHGDAVYPWKRIPWIALCRSSARSIPSAAFAARWLAALPTKAGSGELSRRPYRGASMECSEVHRDRLVGRSSMPLRVG